MHILFLSDLKFPHQGIMVQNHLEGCMLIHNLLNHTGSAIMQIQTGNPIQYLQVYHL